MHPSHRSHGASLKMDEEFRGQLQQCNLMSCFTADVAAQPHTCRSEQWAQRYSSSRIDNFFSSIPEESGPVFASCQLHHVLHDPLYDCSDHYPLIFVPDDADSLLCQVEQPLCVEQPQHQRKLVFTAFPASAIQGWRTRLLSEQSCKIHVTLQRLQQVLQEAEDGEASTDEYVDINDTVNTLLASAVETATSCFPTTLSGSHVVRRRRSYLPRTLAGTCQSNLNLARACRVTSKYAFRCQREGTAYVTFLDDAHVATLLADCPAIYEGLSKLTSYARLHEHLHEQRQSAQKAAKSLLRKHRSEASTRERRRWQRLWYSKRKAAYAQGFQSSHDERGSSPTDMPAVRHPEHGPTAHPALAVEALYTHFSTQASPVVSPSVAQPACYPWHEASMEPFQIQARGNGISRCLHLPKRYISHVSSA